MDFPLRDFDKSLQIVSCTAAEQHLMTEINQGMIVPKDQFEDNCFKEIYILLHLILMLCLICVNTCKSCLDQFGSCFTSTHFIPNFF